MKTLFICRANVGRSQVAMELYRLMGMEADSAGTKVDNPGATLSANPRSATILGVVREGYGVDMSMNVRKQLSQDLAEVFDQLVVMAEPDTVPDWLARDQRAVFWEIKDPKDQDVATTRAIVRGIEEKVKLFGGAGKAVL